MAVMINLGRGRSGLHGLRLAVLLYNPRGNDRRKLDEHGVVDYYNVQHTANAQYWAAREVG